MNKRISVAAAALISAIAAPAHAGPAIPDVPDTIAVGQGHKLSLVGHAVGDQNYRCDPRGGRSSLRAPWCTTTTAT